MKLRKPLLNSLPRLYHIKSLCRIVIPCCCFSPPLVDKSTNYQNYYQGLWDCDGDQPDELSFKRGETIYILSKVGSGDSWFSENVLLCHSFIFQILKILEIHGGLYWKTEEKSIDFYSFSPLKLRGESKGKIKYLYIVFYNSKLNQNEHKSDKCRSLTK